MEPEEGEAPADEAPAAATRRERLLACLPIGVIAIWSYVGSRLVFPYLSHDHDEPVYLLQADALRHGHLTLPVPANGASFRPWLTALRGHHYVFKYSPMHAAFLVVGRVLLGSYRMALPLIAIGLVGLFYLLATEVLPTRRAARLATWVFALSPLVVVESATYLSYTTSLLLLVGFAFALVRGMRGLRGKRLGWLAVAGLALGLAAFERPFDALVFAAPFGVLFLVVAWRRRRLLPWSAAIGAGSFPPLALTALFNKAVTGRLTTFPFSLIDSHDTIGFGNRRLVPSDPFVHYDLHAALASLKLHSLWLQVFAFGGPVLLALFLWRLLRWRTSWVERALAAVAFTVPFGYLFFWGPYNVSLLWSGLRYLGPFYWMPILVPLVLVGVAGLRVLRRQRPALATAALVVMIVADAAALPFVLTNNYHYTTQARRLYAGLRASPAHGRRLILLPAGEGPWLLHPLALLHNDPYLRNPDIYAVDRGSHNFDVVEQFPDRWPFQLEVRGLLTERPQARATTVLVPIGTARAPSFQVHVTFVNTTSEANVAVQVVMGERLDWLVLDSHSHAGARYDLTFGLDGSGVRPADRRQRWTTTPFRHRGFPAVVSVELSDSPGFERRVVAERRYWHRTVGNELELLLPGEGFRNRHWPKNSWRAEDVGDVLSVDLRPAGSPPPAR